MSSSSSSSVLIRYSLDDVERIKDNGFQYTLPQYTLDLINKISKLVGSPDYIKTPIFKKRLGGSSGSGNGGGSYRETNGEKDDGDINSNSKMNSKGYYNNKYKSRHNNNDAMDGDNYGSNAGYVVKAHKKNRKKEKEISDLEWKSIRTFETTKIKKNEEGIQKELNTLRILLNKLTTDTYADIYSEIRECMNILVKQDDVAETDLYEVGRFIFETGAQNSFYSKEYARLFKELTHEFSCMRNVFDHNYRIFLELFDNYEFVSAEEDYDKYCLMNAQNNKRRAVASFMTHLAIEGVVSTGEFCGFIGRCLGDLGTNIAMENKGAICEEITEVLYVMVTKSARFLSENVNEEYSKIREKIEWFSEQSPKAYVSLTNKIVFKCMDICEEIEDL